MNKPKKYLILILLAFLTGCIPESYKTAHTIHKYKGENNHWNIMLSVIAHNPKSLTIPHLLEIQSKDTMDDSATFEIPLYNIEGNVRKEQTLSFDYQIDSDSSIEPIVIIIHSKYGTEEIPLKYWTAMVRSTGYGNRLNDN
ncbi:hypothetical protein [Paenibacillus sp. KN14-4R]|uniref:hypothetical protein n=1 Tax=Paenibacillus sp. KN14-4R TaxID=3445773 RepID=UPI003FA180F5